MSESQGERAAAEASTFLSPPSTDGSLLRIHCGNRLPLDDDDDVEEASPSSADEKARLGTQAGPSSTRTSPVHRAEISRASAAI